MARAKDATRKLIITGESLAGPVEITDARTLALSDVYTGNFLDATHEVRPPGPDAARFQVSFYLPNTRANVLRYVFGPPPPPPLVRAYVVDLALDTLHHVRSVYLPGDGDSWAPWNHGTIIRKKQEGRWRPTAAMWGEAIEAAILRARRRPPPSCAAAGEVALVHAGDSAYRDVSGIVDRLERHGVQIFCVYRSTLDGMFGDARGLGVMTRHGPMAVFTFGSVAEAAAATLSTSVVGGQLVTVVRVPGRQRPDSVFGADRTDFVRYDRWVIDTFQQPSLRAAASEALTQSPKPNEGSRR